MPDFLLEIGTEEIPARMIDAASTELQRRVTDLLARERLLNISPQGLEPPFAEDRDGAAEAAPLRNPRAVGDGRAVERYSTPRRLALLVRGLASAQADVEEQITGPSLKVAYKDGQPGPAAQAFAKKVDVPVEKLETVKTPKGEYLAARTVRRGRAAGEVLAEALPKEIASLYWPKTMYWERPTERFVRPLRWLVAMLDGAIVPLEFAGIKAGRSSRGHRTLGKDVTLGEPASYAVAMKQGSVLVSSEERRLLIRNLLDHATRAVPAARWREDKELLETVVNLTEFPSVVLGSFDREFLELADEVLVTVMRDHQKYFAVEDSAGKLLPHFLAVLNTDGDPEGIIRHGHERVLRARFNDARFFWQTDQKIPLRERVPMLKAVTFQKDLGSYYEKALRVQRLGSQISQSVKDAGLPIRPGVVHKAALLAKTDLTTELVKEFTELQGIIGGLYARVQQHDAEMTPSAREAIAQAIYDQYKPESMDDSSPRTLEGAVLSMADKADTIAGMFGLAMVPSGSKDPFAVRRQANGIVKIVAEHKLALSIARIMADARLQYQGSAAEKKFASGFDYPGTVRDFFRERLEFYLREVRGFAYDTVNAVLAAGADDVLDALARAEAVAQVRDLPDFLAIAAAFKRIRNIMKQAAEKDIAVATEFEFSPEAQPEEKLLRAKADELATRFQKAVGDKRYVDALIQLSTLRPHVDLFFDKVLVMANDERVRANRLALLQRLLHEFSTIADFSEIVTEGK